MKQFALFILTYTMWLTAMAQPFITMKRMGCLIVTSPNCCKTSKG